jgi:hypothetical protein
MAADGVRCHVRLAPHRFFVRQSSDLDCAIEVVPQRLMFEICCEQGEPHVICMLSKIMTALKTIFTSTWLQVFSIPMTDPNLPADSFGWQTSQHLRATLIRCFASCTRKKIKP